MSLIKLNATYGLTGTLPAVSGANLTNVSAGKVLQYVYSENAYQHTTTSGSYIDIQSSSGTTWETAITPSATSSKIIIASTICIYWEANGNSNNRGNMKLLSKTGSGSYATLQSCPIGNYDYGGSGVQSRHRVPFHYLISPSTTSAVTIKFQMQSSGGCTTAFGDGGTSDSSLTLYEVAG